MPEIVQAVYLDIGGVHRFAQGGRDMTRYGGHPAPGRWLFGRILVIDAGERYFLRGVIRSPFRGLPGDIQLQIASAAGPSI